jgi:hypothetical protein
MAGTCSVVFAYINKDLKINNGVIARNVPFKEIFKGPKRGFSNLV